MLIRWLLTIALLLPSGAGAQSPVTQPQRPGQPRLDVDFEATVPVVASAMLELAAVTSADVVMDLGCGEGDIANAAARQFGARSICVELDPLRIAKAREGAAKAGVADKVTFIEGDLFKADLAPASVITLFLWDTLNVRLRPKLLELTPGTRIVSHSHAMGDWRPERREVHNQKSRDGPSAIYLWIIPARIAGTWTLETGGERHEVQLVQTYQYVADARPPSRGKARIRSGRILGDVASFELVTGQGKLVSLLGRVRGETIASEDGIAAPPAARVKLPATAAPFRMQRLRP